MTLPVAGSQFNQNRPNVVKVAGAVTQQEQCGIVHRRLCEERYTSPMERFSQTSFLNGPPQPLVFTMEGRGRTPFEPVSYTHLRAHETGRNLVCRLLLE